MEMAACMTRKMGLASSMTSSGHDGVAIVAMGLLVVVGRKQIYWAPASYFAVHDQRKSRWRAKEEQKLRDRAIFRARDTFLEPAAEQQFDSIFEMASNPAGMSCLAFSNQRFHDFCNVNIQVYVCSNKNHHIASK
uniref:Uncharacterized protein n=1 Tax=Romanomermis culicivorax TaxID=13658 RepID=A0A915HMG1_ROMCU